MGFTTPCFIRKNTPEIRKKLEELGYKDYGKLRFYGEPIIIYCDVNHFFTSPFVLEGEQYIGKYDNFIDCGDNEDLFLAIAALRDDNDYMQWFVSAKTHTKRLSGCFGQVVGMDGHYKEIVGYEWHKHENNDNALTERLNAMIQMEVEDMEFLPHKATVEEIIEHFKK